MKCQKKIRQNSIRTNYIKSAYFDRFEEKDCRAECISYFIEQRKEFL